MCALETRLDYGISSLRSFLVDGAFPGRESLSFTLQPLSVDKQDLYRAGLESELITRARSDARREEDVDCSLETVGSRHTGDFCGTQ